MRIPDALAEAGLPSRYVAFYHCLAEEGLLVRDTSVEEITERLAWVTLGSTRFTRRALSKGRNMGFLGVEGLVLCKDGRLRGGGRGRRIRVFFNIRKREGKKGGFYQVPPTLGVALRRLGRKGWDIIALYHRLARRLSRDGTARASFGKLREICRMNYKRLRESLDFLVGAGVLHLRPFRNGRGFSYRLRWKPGEVLMGLERASKSAWLSEKKQGHFGKKQGHFRSPEMRLNPSPHRELRLPLRA